MLERLIENWLVNSGERGYEVAFAQLLAAEDYRVIQGPVHHPFEHGKDILAFAPDGRLHAFQLKGPKLTKLEDFEEIQGQLLALAGTAVTHPAVEPARRPDRTFLVTNANLTAPVRDRIEKFNAGNVPLGWGPIEPIEREQLLSRFLVAHGKYLPQQLPEVRTLLELYYTDPTSLFPVREFSRYVDALLPTPADEPTGPDLRRAIASLTLLTAYAASSWTNAGNHLCVAQAWLTACVTLLRFAGLHGLNAKMWRPSYDLAFDAARASMASLAKETSNAKDLVIPDLMEGLVYPSRATLVCGFLSAYLLSERTLGIVNDEQRDGVRTVLKRERTYARISGESEVPCILLMSAALEQLGEIRFGEAMSLSLVRTLSSLNQRDSKDALPDPYHSTEEVLLRNMGADSGLEGEHFDGHSHMLAATIQWVARRLWRQFLGSVWADITHIELIEFQPSSPLAYLAEEDEDGIMRVWFAGQPQSWSALLKESRTLNRAQLPDLLWDRRELMPYLPLLYPYRFTSTLAGAIDLIATDPTA